MRPQRGLRLESHPRAAMVRMNDSEKESLYEDGVSLPYIIQQFR